MPRYELSIHAEYLKGSWGPFEGVRELVQNARDAEVEFSAPMTIEHYNGGEGQLRITNEGTSLTKEALLMGATTKSGKEELIGKWGEGLKVGVLALLRSGYKVKIRTGDEVWIPTIERSERYNAEVMVFNVSVGRKEQNRVRVEISPFDKEDWEKWRKLFLFLDKKRTEENQVKSYWGALLLDPELKGHVFVKGIATEQIPDLAYGYDFYRVTLDRDRKMVNRWDLEYYTTTIWNEALARRPDLLDPAFQMLQRESADSRGFATTLHEDNRKRIAQKFTETYGENALPAASIGDSAQLEHFGKKGIVVPKPMREVLDRVFGTTEQCLASLAKQPEKQYGWSDLSEEEKENLLWAVDLVSKEEPRVNLDLLKICDFQDEGIRGCYQKEEDEVTLSLSKRILEKRTTTLQVLIHEAAHLNCSADGEHAHVRRIENLWAAIVEKLLLNQEKHLS